MSYKTAYDSVHFYLNDLGARVVAKTGIPTDRHHFGKIIHHSFKENPDFIMQIDGATGESETNGSALNRSVRCAVAFKTLGLQKGDVMVLMGPNHLELCIPHYAALYLGIMVAAVDTTLGVQELQDTFNVTRPNIIFCQSEKVPTIEEALKLAGLVSKIVTFDDGSQHTTFGELLKTADEDAVASFLPADFDPAETPAYLTSTSGTTGTPKAATLTHQNLFIGISYLWLMFTKFPTPTRMALVVSPLQWLSAGMQFLFSPILRVTRLQTSAAITPEHFVYLLNTYKPTFTAASPVLMNNLLPYSDQCDFSCFDAIVLGGSAVSPELCDQFKTLIKSDQVFGLYGMSEAAGIVFQNDYPPPKGSSGCARGALEYRLVDPTTKKDVTEPKVPGELWIRGLQVFKGYYNNPEMTAETLTEDGWLKSGDIFYRDEYYHFYFVERLKSLLKYKNHQVSPVEIEMVIRRHPGVLDACVTGIPDKECGDLVVACVTRKTGSTVTAQEIKDIVKETLTDSKQLRGGVIFMKEFPLTSSSKINRKKVQELALTLERE
ncbi:luciferin 4-monooxygenase-like isoform X2 [Anticarsia gemmatalis]|uniref:luciferin 4-monooxygenase-like isoform X2 n=1 Tax=Anticarsia gemmatalis TaxID=129554 RepID=UPI003F773A19